MTDPKPFVIPPDLPADVMQYERGWNACLEALAVAPADESPALPEAAGSFYVQNFRQDPGMRNVEFQERTEFGQGSHILFTADQMHAYAREALAPEPATPADISQPQVAQPLPASGANVVCDQSEVSP